LELDLLFEMFDQTFQMFQISAPWFSDVIPGLPVGLFVATPGPRAREPHLFSQSLLATKDQAKPYQPEYIQPSPKDHLLGTMHDLKCRLCLSETS
jgi:hypothetical protein